MKPEIQTLLEQVQSPDLTDQEEGGLALWMLLEKNFGINRRDPLHREILPDHLFLLELTDEDLAEIVYGVERILFSEGIPLKRRASLVGVLNVAFGVETLRVALVFLRRFESALDDDSAHSVLSAIMPTCFPSDQFAVVASLLEQNETEAILNRLLLRNSERLNEPIALLLRSIGQLRK